MAWITNDVAERLGAQVYSQCLRTAIQENLAQALSFQRGPLDDPEDSGLVDRSNLARLHWHAYARLECLHRGDAPYTYGQPWVCTAREDRELRDILDQKLMAVAASIGKTLHDIPVAARFAATCLRQAAGKAWVE